MSKNNFPILNSELLLSAGESQNLRKLFADNSLLEMDLSQLKAIGLDETASKRGHNYVTVFIDMDRSDKPMVFATPGKGKETVKQFKTFLEGHDGKGENILEVACDMSPAFLAAAKEELTEANVTIDWFHVYSSLPRY